MQFLIWLALSLATVDGYALVHLGGGPPNTGPVGARPTGPTRRITGRVVDARGRAVAGAIVLAHRTFDVVRETLLADAGSTTDARGEFVVADAPAGTCFVLAMTDDGWSEVVEATSRPVELRLGAGGALNASLTYSGGDEAFTVTLTRHDTPFSARFETDSHGRLHTPSLPTGRYTLRAGLAQSAGTGASATIEREIAIEPNKSTDLELAFAAGTTLAITATAPGNAKTPGFVYWLFRDRAARDAADARARRTAENAPTYSTNAAVGQFHDIPPGTYFACAGVFDVRTMDALDHPFGCAKVTVRAEDSVREVPVTLSP